MPRLSVLVPVYNEARTLKRVMDALVIALPESQIVYIDDGSTDASLEILKRHARGSDIVLHQENGGKGLAIQRAAKEASGDYCVIQDADLEYDPSDINLLLKVTEGKNDAIVFGSRFLRPNPNIYPLYLLGNKVLTAMVNLLFRGHLTDSYTCYKLFPTMWFRSLPLQSRGFELEAELCALALKDGRNVDEVAISYHPRSFEEGKKIGMKDAFKGILTMLRIRLS